MTELNKYICDGTVITQEAFDKTMDGDESANDPKGLEIELDKGEDMIAADVAEKIAELEGHDKGVAICRALYDLNEMEGGFCCFTTKMEIDNEAGYGGTMINSKKAVLNDIDPIVVDFGEGYEITVTWGAEVFASAKGLAASALTMAAAMVIAQH